jgi:hypothetical protein
MAVLFLTNETVTPETLTLLRSLKIEKKLSSMGIERRLYQLNQSVQNAESMIAGAVREAQARGVPSVVFVYGSGKYRFNNMPETADNLERLINGIR